MAPATCKFRKIHFCPQINLSNLQPADEEYELEDEENWEEDFRLRVELLVSNQRENEVRICRHVHHLLTNMRNICKGRTASSYLTVDWRYRDVIVALHSLQTFLEPHQSSYYLLVVARNYL